MNEDTLKKILRAFLNGAHLDDVHIGLWRATQEGWLRYIDPYLFSESEENAQIDMFVHWYMDTVRAVEQQRMLEQKHVNAWWCATKNDLCSTCYSGCVFHRDN